MINWNLEPVNDIVREKWESSAEGRRKGLVTQLIRRNIEQDKPKGWRAKGFRWRYPWGRILETIVIRIKYSGEDKLGRKREILWFLELGNAGTCWLT